MDKNHAQQLIEEFLRRFGVTHEGLEVTELPEGGLRCVIRTGDSHLLIGTRGRTYAAVGHVLRKMIARIHQNPEFNFQLEINDYREELERRIKTKTTMLAERARALNTEVEMEPMESYERMIVHSLFSENPEFETFSRGQGAKRRVVIRHTGGQKGFLT